MSKDWQQYFPTYRFDESKNRDIALEEYKACCKILESEEKIFDNLVKYIIAFGTILISLITGLNDKIPILFKDYESIYWAILVLVFLFFLFMTKNFADKQRSIVFAKRKIVMLRRMLGIDYGTQEFLFKKGMLEGASMPFSIKLEFSYLFLPILTLNAVSIFVIANIMNIPYAIELTAIISIALFCLYMYWILDLNETLYLIVFRALFRGFGLEFEDNFEHILYRAKLAVYEAKRHKVNFNDLKEMLIAIEDRKFYQHSGVDYRATFRALLSHCRKVPLLKHINFIKKIPYSGGSTITQQLFRTLFIKNIDKKKVRRKIAEIIFARLWLNKTINKDFQLEIYLAQVRFDRGIYGILAAMKHYYGKIIANPTKAQSFFLIERISVVSQKMFPKIVDIAIRLKNKKHIDENDIKEIIHIYKSMTDKGSIIKNDEILQKLEKISH